MEGIGHSDNKTEKINENILVKKNNRMSLFVAFIILIAILILNKDMIISGYDQLFSKNDASDDKSSERTEEPPTEENNPIKEILNKTNKAEDIVRKANLRDMGLALELYFAENGSYPVSITPVKLNDTNSLAYKDLIKYTNPETLKDPKDPDFFYLYRSDGKSYEITTRLENNKDSECEISESGICIYKTTGPSK